MFRSGFFFSVSGPAALLTLLIHPTVQQAADQWVARPSVPAIVQSSLPGQRVASTAISPIHVASEPRTLPTAAERTGRTASEKDQPKVRRLMREGCEGAISSLAGPEARRMLPGRCIS